MDKKITYIILDIDGVLTTNKQFNTNKKKFMEKYEWAGKLKVPYPFDPKCVEILNDILIQTDAEIILSSDWKLYWSLSQLDIIFKSNGVIKSPIDVTTEDLVSMSHMERNRAYQIKTYIKKNKLENFVILEDLNIIDFILDYSKQIVRTTNSEGLKQCSIKDKIINILK